MRRLLAGLILLVLSFPAIAFADLKGEVESIGFGSLYRPNCWTPMLVRVAAEKSGTYQIRVIQEDLDRDHEIFREDVSLTAPRTARPSSASGCTSSRSRPTVGFPIRATAGRCAICNNS